MAVLDEYRAMGMIVSGEKSKVLGDKPAKVPLHPRGFSHKFSLY
jgi:hypothetical protein